MLSNISSIVGSPEDVKIYREIERQKNLADNKSVFAVKVKLGLQIHLVFS